MTQKQAIYTERVRKVLKQTKQGEPLYGDGLGLPNEIGVLETPTLLVGSGTYVDTNDLSRIVTEVTLANCRKRAVAGIAVSTAPVSGIVTLDLAEGDLFIIDQDEDILEINIVNTIIGLEHSFVVIFEQDAIGGWTTTFDVTADAAPVTTRWSGGSEPVMTTAANSIDAMFFLLGNGVNLTGSFLLDLKEDTALNKNRLNYNKGTRIFKSAKVLAASQRASICEEIRKIVPFAQVPLVVEGDAVQGTVQMFGSSPEKITATDIKIQSGVVTPVKFDTLIDLTSTDTSSTLLVTTDTITLNMLVGRMFDAPLDVQLLNIVIVGVPTFDGVSQPYTQASLLLVRDDSVSQRAIDWSTLTVNGSSVPVYWEGGIEIPLTQTPDKLTCINFIIFENFVIVRISDELGVPVLVAPRRETRKVVNE